MTLRNISFSTWLTMVMLIIFTTMVCMSFGFPAKARFMPLVVGLPGIVFCLIQLVIDLRTPAAAAPRPAVQVTLPSGVSPETEAPHEELPEFGPHTARQEVLMWVYFVAFIAGLLAFGFYVAVPVMLLTFLRTQAEAGWKFSIALAAAATLALYLMFGVLLRIELHQGFITPWVLHSLGLNWL